MKKKIIIGIAIILFIILIVVIVWMFKRVKKSKNESGIIRIDNGYEVIAEIKYGSRFAADAGSSYECIIGKKVGESYYSYEIFSSQITFAGAGEKKVIKRGKINKRLDLLKLNETIEMDISGKMIEYSYINYEYMADPIDTIEEFADRLFEN